MALGERVEFRGEVDRSETIRGTHRFNSGAQGVWFRLADERDTTYHFLVPSIEAGLSSGVLERRQDGEIRFRDLEGRRVAGAATVRSEATRDVISLHVEDGS